MSKITPVTMWKVEGFSELFPSEKVANENLATRDLAELIEKHSELDEDDSWNLATVLRSEFSLVPKSKTPSELLKEFTEATQLYMNPESATLVEYIQDAY